MDLVRVELQGEVARVTLDRPDKLNAVNNAMWDRLGELFAELDADGAALRDPRRRRRAGVQRRRRHRRVRGESQLGRAGPQLRQAHPCRARRDRSLPPSGDRRDPRPLRRRRARAGDAAATCGSPARAPASASRSSAWALSWPIPSCEPLVELVGPANAMEILLEGQVFGRSGPATWGSSIAWCRTMRWPPRSRRALAASAEGAPLVARWHKKFTRRLMQPAPLTAEGGRRELTHCFGTEDFRTGYQAFLAKAKPTFRGR